jgi:hypothetical protein
MDLCRNNIAPEPDFEDFQKNHKYRLFVLQRSDFFLDSDYGWYFTTRFKKNRKFTKKKLTDHKSHPYWMEKVFPQKSNEAKRLSELFKIKAR